MALYVTFTVALSLVNLFWLSYMMKCILTYHRKQNYRKNIVNVTVSRALTNAINQNTSAPILDFPPYTNNFHTSLHKI